MSGFTNACVKDATMHLSPTVRIENRAPHMRIVWRTAVERPFLLRWLGKYRETERVIVLLPAEVEAVRRTRFIGIDPA